MSQEEAGEIQTTRKRWRNVDEEEAEISGREKRQRYLNDDEEEEVSELPDSYQRPPSVNLDVNGDAPGENNTPIPGSLRTEGQISIDQGLIQQLVNTLQGINSNQYQQPPQHQPYQLPPPHQYVQPPPVPKFRKTMSVAGWEKTVRVWSNSHSHIPEPIRLTMTLESLKANEGDFDIEHQGAMEDFMEKFKKKFEIPNWRKCVEIYEQFKTFQHKTMKDPRNTSKDGWN